MADLLQSELIKLRAMEPEDIEILYRWENDTDIWKVSNTIAPFSKYVLRQFIEHMAFERAGRAALKADELAVRGGLGAADIAVARARAVHGGDLGDDAVRDEALYGAVNGGLADRNAVLRQPQADLINGQKVLLLLPEQGEDAVLLSGMVLHISYPPKRIKLKLIFILIYIIRFTKRFVKGEKYSIFVKNV